MRKAILDCRKERAPHFSRARRRNRDRAIAALLMAGGFACAMPLHADPRNNPGYDRPGIGFTPAVLQAGDVTVEQGLPDCTVAGGTSSCSADSLLRVGLGHALEVQVGSGWDHLAGGASASGRADSTLALKVAPAAAGNFSWGVTGSVEFSDGAPAFRTPTRQYLVGASFNWQGANGHATGLNGEWQGGNQHSRLLAVNESWAPTPRFGTYVELAAQDVGGSGSGWMAGGGLTFMATPRVQLDLGARHRLAGHIDTWQGGAGVSVYFGD